MIGIPPGPIGMRCILVHQNGREHIYEDADGRLLKRTADELLGGASYVVIDANRLAHCRGLVQWTDPRETP